MLALYQVEKVEDGTNKEFMLCMVRINRFGVAGEQTAEKEAAAFMICLAEQYASGRVHGAHLYEARDAALAKLEVSTPR